MSSKKPSFLFRPGVAVKIYECRGVMAEVCVALTPGILVSSQTQGWGLCVSFAVRSLPG